ncbi:hypothetical protein ASD21_05750 [Caulobacter sp. Root1455]|uniref:hypothetical protein n=1 Tax=Caulobacter sp. Root1455 TaxID=1736465 RepID=UPI0006FCD529|nr:hypothetical protein [Caulobacter sp. Root1455]KQY96007.1 hypothetical protein ASD21_05750 [Caulobacter sp. Root1455]
MKVSRALAMLLSLTAGSALAQDAPPVQLPAQVKALAGCWGGAGEVMGKPVTIVLSAKPIVEGAMFQIEAESQAKADPADRYAAHLVIGARAPKGAFPATLTGYWADSFGGDYTATGAGAVREDGFEIAYPYPPSSFLNRWTLAGDRLDWRITAREGDKEEPFAHYEATRITCPSAQKHG